MSQTCDDQTLCHFGPSVSATTARLSSAVQQVCPIGPLLTTVILSGAKDLSVCASRDTPCPEPLLRQEILRLTAQDDSKVGPRLTRERGAH
jgi:hypothetical protein